MVRLGEGGESHGCVDSTSASAGYVALISSRL